jgi:predicted metal-dependent hydrolase
MILFVHINKTEVIYIESKYDSETYLVRNYDNKDEAANLLATIKKLINEFTSYLHENKKEFPYYEQYIDRLYKHSKKTILSESSPDSKYTSYTINKGDEMVLCIRDKENSELIDLNVIIYVVIHELSHIACPQIGHTKLFKEIFPFFLKIAIKIGIYKFVDYESNPIRYCGMTINENILKSNI